MFSCISHIYLLYSSKYDVEHSEIVKKLPLNKTSYHQYNFNYSFKDNTYFREILIYNCIKDAFNNNYDKICFLYPDVKIINDNIENFKYYNIFCLNPKDVNNDCVILDRSVIKYIINLPTQNFSNTFWKQNIFNYLNKNFKIYYPEQNYVKHKVDYVLTYVNDKDKNWQITYKNTFNNLNYRKVRFEDYNCLEELINGINKYASFIDNIYIVVQNTSEVSEDVRHIDNVKIIEHKEIVPQKYLPMFNSCSIEMFIGNIPNLSEYFIYGNDDMFFTNFVDETDFFIHGKIISKLNDITSSDNSMYFDVVRNSFKIFFKEFAYTYFKDKNFSKSYKKLIHTPHSIRKSTCYHINNLYTNEIEKSLTLLRSNKNLNQYIYTFYEYFYDNIIDSNKFIYKYFGKDDDLKISNEQIICVNEHKDNLKSLLQQSLNKYPLNIALCAIAKNENLYIREWVEHYKNIGVSKIFLYDNNDIDGERFEEVINDYIESDFVEVIDVRGIWPSQIESYNNFYHSSKSSQFDWILYCDIDEFLEMDNKFSNINQYLKQQHFNEFDVIKICWKCFDDNDLVYVKDNNYSIKRFTRAQKNTPWTNSQTKMFIKTNLNIIINSPHGALETNEINKHLNVCNSKGEKMNRNNILYDAAGIKFKHDDCWLNHYRCKTIEEYVVKAKRGWPTIYKNGGKQYMNARFFFVFNSYSREKHKHFAKLLEKEYKSITSWGSILQNRNWGDDINFSFLPELFDFNFEFIIANKNLNEPNYACIGSIINDNFITKNTIIWGAGIDSESSNLTIKPKEVLAVRGPLTRKKLLELNIECPEVYGDPALLIHKFYKPDITKEFKLGIIPHFSNLNDKCLTNLKNPHIKILNLKQYNSNWKNIIDDILKCEYIISESLHGIILAEQYNIPNIWINIKDTKEKNKGIFKYLDFYESIGKTDIKNFIKIDDFNNIDEIINIINSTYYTKFEIDLDKLINVCPFGKITNTNLLNNMKYSKDV